MISFETKCYENDWEFILKGTYLEKMIRNCGVTFANRTVIINNVEDPHLAAYHANKMVARGVIDSYHLVDHHAANVLEFFNIEESSFNGGYPYSIAELTGIYVCETPYLLHFSSDSFPDKDPAGWITEAIQIFNQREDIVVANPTWDYRFEHAEEESFDSIGNFYLGEGFSDQCYLIKTGVFRQPIYNEQHPASDRYPKYGGELFEKRVDSYMRNHRLLRITSKKTAYAHENFPKTFMDRWKRKRAIRKLD